MGEWWTLLNIEKQERIFYGKYSTGSYWKSLIEFFCNEDSERSWAGDRLVFLGDLTNNVPAGILKDGESENMLAIHGPKRLDRCDVGGSSLNGYTETSVLRNLCNREYIRADLFPYQPEDRGHPGLTDVLLEKIIWSWRRGSWAGGRFEIVELSLIEDASGWKDITESTFFNYCINSDMTHWRECQCNLCKKFKDGREEFYKTLKAETMLVEPVRAREAIGLVSSGVIHAAFGVGTNHLSKIETLPAELQDHILAHLDLHEVAACAATSKQTHLSLHATRILYTSVRLRLASQPEVLLQALKRRPELAGHIKELHLVTMAHWKSLQIVHEILKKLPALQSLELAPCWFSYGDLAYWEYPFTLRSLKWGLKNDPAFQAFSGSQPDAKVDLIDPSDLLPELFWGENDDPSGSDKE